MSNTQKNPFSKVEGTMATKKWQRRICVANFNPNEIGPLFHKAVEKS